jgi:hypothetical protein
VQGGITLELLRTLQLIQLPFLVLEALNTPFQAGVVMPLVLALHQTQ